MTLEHNTRIREDFSCRDTRFEQLVRAMQVRNDCCKEIFYKVPSRHNIYTIQSFGIKDSACHPNGVNWLSHEPVLTLTELEGSDLPIPINIHFQWRKTNFFEVQRIQNAPLLLPAVLAAFLPLISMNGRL